MDLLLWTRLFTWINVFILSAIGIAAVKLITKYNQDKNKKDRQ